MMVKYKYIFLIFICILVVSISVAISRKCSQSDDRWADIEQFFSPPDVYNGAFGDYRSLLIFMNGDTVKTPLDWSRRRDEIKKNWMEMMGEWPPLIENQNPEIIEISKNENFTQYKIIFYWTPTEKTDGYLLVPHAEGRKPAVITVYYEPETAIGEGKLPYRDFAKQLAQRGFVALSLGTREATKSQTYSIYYPSIDEATVEPLSMLAYAAANAWHVLANIAEVDSTRIGIMGHSFGGKWAMFASCLYDRFACAAWSDPGIVFDETRADINYWEPYYLGYTSPPWRERGIITDNNPASGTYLRLRDNGYDLHELHALMAPRPFLVSGGACDPPGRWIALNHTVNVNRLLGYENRVAMTNREKHATDSLSNNYIYSFFEYFLK